MKSLLRALLIKKSLPSAALSLAVLLFASPVFASSAGPLVPISDGNYAQWTPSAGTSHFANVDETPCNGTTDYNSTTGVGNRDSYGVNLSSVPNGATITQIEVKPCAGRSANGGSSDPVMNVFYRTGGANSSDAGSYSLTSTNVVDLATTSFSGLSITKGSGTSLEVGAVLSSAPTNKGARLSRIAATLTYTPLTAPTNLTGMATTGSQILLTWTDTSSNEDGFNVERSTDGTTWTSVASTSANVSSFYDTGLSNGTTYYHRVRAFNSGAYTGYTNVATTSTSGLSAAVAYWKLDGNSTDSVGSNNGSDTNITYSTGNGVINQGAGFDGSSSGINVGNMVSGPLNVSAAAWIKTTSDGRIIQQRDNIVGQWVFSVLGGKLSMVEQSDGIPGTASGSGNTTVTDGSWHHVAVVQDNDTYTFYVDGVTDGSFTGGPATPNYGGSVDGSIGYDRRDGSHHFNGDIDEVGVWNTSLSSSDVAALYNSGAGEQYPF